MCDLCVERGEMTPAELGMAEQERDVTRIDVSRLSLTEMLDGIDQLSLELTRAGAPVTVAAEGTARTIEAWLASHPEATTDDVAMEMIKRIDSRLKEMGVQVSDLTDSLRRRFTSRLN